MSFLCPDCKFCTLDLVQALELPPDSYNDEIAFQITRCDHCGFHAFAVYKESRHGALDSEAWSHEGYRVSEEDFQAVLESINRCPRPTDINCDCHAHQSLGQMRGYSWDGLRLSGVKILGVFNIQADNQMN